MNYKEIIDRNNKNFIDIVETEIAYVDGACYENEERNKRCIEFNNKQLISFLEEENKRLDDIHKQFPENETVLEDIFKNTENMNRVYARVGYRKALNDQIAHNKEIISYLKEM